jgi:flagellar biosynthesis anti-sigma factor FlgM
MKINNQPTPPSAAQAGKTDATQSASGRRGSLGRTSSGSGADGVELSTLAERISQGLEVAEGSRAAYVSRIAESIRSGQYQVDSLAISRGLIDEATSKK